MTTSYTNDLATGNVSADGFVGPLTNGNPNAPVYGPASLPSGSKYSAASYTAHSGGGKASATVVSAVYAVVPTAAADADSILIPAATVGALQIIVNSSAHAVQVFATGASTINGAAAATGVSVAAGKTALFICAVAGAWVGPVALA